MKKISLILIFVFICNVCFADIFIFVGNSIAQGKVVNEDDGIVVIQDKQGKTRSIDRELILYQLPEEGDVISDSAMKQQQYLAYIAIQNISKTNDDMKSMAQWGFGIACVGLVISLALYTFPILFPTK